MNTPKNIFAKRLTDLINEYNFTRDKVAQEIGVTRQSIGKWANGDTVPDVFNAAKLAIIFNVSLDYLAGICAIKSFDKDIKSVHEYTGLSDISIANINDLTADDKEKLNRLFENKKFVKFLILLSELEEK